MTYRRCICHPDDLPGVGISSGWVTANSLCHPDDILFHFMSSGWLNWGWFLIRMSYGNVIMSSGWDTLPFLSHPDEIANFDFPQHAVALQRFRIIHYVNPVSRYSIRLLFTCMYGRSGYQSRFSESCSSSYRRNREVEIPRSHAPIFFALRLSCSLHSSSVETAAKFRCDMKNQYHALNAFRFRWTSR